MSISMTVNTPVLGMERTIVQQGARGSELGASDRQALGWKVPKHQTLPS
jgi:hypothetical protein